MNSQPYSLRRGSKSPAALEIMAPTSSTGLDIWLNLQPVVDTSQFEKLGQLLFGIIGETTGTATLSVST